MGSYCIGTSGFSYSDWAGPFYPEGLSKSEFLPYYAERFPFVELNFTYYRQPNCRAMEKLAEKTPEGFLFSVKAHQGMTHERGENWAGETDTFVEGIAPLSERERLAGVLLQFPYSFHYTPENRRYLAALTDRLASSGGAAPDPLLVEFRNAEWNRESVYTELAERKVGTVATDTPKLKNLPETEAHVTSETAYLRLHGRNTESWWTGDNTSRYDYLYSREELTELEPIIRTLIQKSTRLFIAFNNHHKGQAVKNAFMLRELLEAG